MFSLKNNSWNAALIVLMWKAVRNKNNAHKNNTRASHLLIDIEQVNAFFASFLNDSSYKAENVSAYRPLKACDFQPFYAY